MYYGWIFTRRDNAKTIHDELTRTVYFMWKLNSMDTMGVGVTILKLSIQIFSLDWLH